MVNQSEAEKIADAYMEHMSSGNLEGVIALYAEDATLEDPVGTEVRSGIGSITEFYRGALQSKLALKRTGPVRLAANEMVFPFVCDIMADGQTTRIEIIDHFVINNDKQIQAMRAFWSPANMTSGA